jgi:hypothetical protein
MTSLSSFDKTRKTHSWKFGLWSADTWVRRQDAEETHKLISTRLDDCRGGTFVIHQKGHQELKTGYH